jgi:cyclophilin family peptidyl-prolyl cis-trans isomerase
VRRPTRLIALLGACCLLSLAGCGGDDSKKPKKPTPASDTASGNKTRTKVGCTKVAEPKPHGAQQLAKPTLKLDRKKTWTATVSTNCGDFVIALDVRRSPKTTASFVYLVRKGFYNGLTFHRVVPSFVIQGGDPQGDGTGGPGYSIVEAPRANQQYLRGVVAMAKTQAEAPGTSGSQFYVVTAEDAQLPADYAYLGKVISGQAVVDRIGVVQTDPQTEKPVNAVVIKKITIASK